jgi:hypothetical protein
MREPFRQIATQHQGGMEQQLAYRAGTLHLQQQPDLQIVPWDLILTDAHH